MTALAPRPRATSTTVEGVVEAAIDGDARAWETICRTHMGDVRAVALARLQDSHAAEDVVQETFLRAWTRLHQVDDAHRLGAWLKAIAANVAVDHVRRQHATAPLDAAAPRPAPGPTHDEHVVAREEAAVLHRHLQELREVDRRALWQRDAHGVPVGELADELGMTAGSVRVLLTRARKRLRDGYGLVTVPFVGLVGRLRSRTAGLGDAVPAAIVAPVLVVAVVAGVATPSAEGVDSTSAPLAVESAPAADSTPLRGDGPIAPAASDETATTGDPVAVTRVVDRGTSTPSDAPDAPGVDLGEESVGFSDGAPTEDDADASPDAPVGPVDGLEVYLEGSGVGELDQGCLLSCD